MKQRYFIAGTDTNVGKTMIACGLLCHAKQQGLSTAAVKPVAAGCDRTPHGLRNDDALQLMQQSTLSLAYEQVNPIAYNPPIAPHIAAVNAGKHLNADRLVGFTRGVFMHGADITLVEGAGGWRVPLNARESLADVAKQLQLPVILVVGMKLGCLNHALLTAEAIHRDGLPIAGWVANCIDPDMQEREANIHTLRQRFSAPCLGVIPYWQEQAVTQNKAQWAAHHLVLP